MTSVVGMALMLPAPRTRQVRPWWSGRRWKAARPLLERRLVEPRLEVDLAGHAHEEEPVLEREREDAAPDAGRRRCARPGRWAGAAPRRASAESASAVWRSTRSVTQGPLSHSSPAWAAPGGMPLGLRRPPRPCGRRPARCRPGALRQRAIRSGREARAQPGAASPDAGDGGVEGGRGARGGAARASGMRGVCRGDGGLSRCGSRWAGWRPGGAAAHSALAPHCSRAADWTVFATAPVATPVSPL